MTYKKILNLRSLPCLFIQKWKLMFNFCTTSCIWNYIIFQTIPNYNFRLKTVDKFFEYFCQPCAKNGYATIVVESDTRNLIHLSNILERISQIVITMVVSWVGFRTVVGWKGFKPGGEIQSFRIYWTLYNQNRVRTGATLTH